jgi:putative hydrolase of the HAD superfamily
MSATAAFAPGSTVIKAITFDATGTLLHSPSLGAVYAEVLGRHGVSVEGARARELVRQVWQEFDCASGMERDRFASHPGGARGWWRDFLDRFCAHLDAGPASPFAAAELYDRFSKAESWELFSDVRPALEALGAAGIELAVVSNWDERLPGLLSDLGVAGYFREILCSAEVGLEKPHPGIFESTLAALGAEPEEVLHVGDSRRLDLEGAQAIGMHALLLDRDGRGDLRSLADLPKLVPAVG